MIIKAPSIRHPYYSPEYIEFALNDFKNKDRSGKVFNDLIKEFRETFISLPIFLIRIKKGTVLYRGRKPELFKEDMFTKLEQISIKPKEKVKSFGRANIPGQAIFYASSKPETVVREVTQWYLNDTGHAEVLINKNIMQSGFNAFAQMITISEWLVKEDLVLASLLFNDYAINNNPLFKEFDDSRKVLPEGKNEKFHKSQNLILDFFSKEYARTDIKVEQDYLFSAYYAHEVYNLSNNSKKIDGLIYSSVANNYDGENIAITETSFQNKLQFLGATFCYTVNLNEKPMKGNIRTGVGAVQEAELQNDGTLIWKDIKYKKEIE